jgi:hypothetical protein
MSDTTLDARVPVSRASVRRWTEALGASLVLHAVALAGLVAVESHWIAARFPSPPSLPVELVPAAAPPAVPEPRPVPVPASEPAPRPNPVASRPQAAPPPSASGPPGVDPDRTPDPVAPARPGTVSPWWSGRISTVALVDDWRAGRVERDTTWLPAVPAALAARDSAFHRMNRDFLGRIPEITYEAWAERQRRNFPLMR